MIRAWWQHHMDDQRVLSLALGIPGVALVLLALAAVRGFPEWSVGSAIAIALGFATGAYVTHREAGRTRRLLWAAAYASLALVTGGTLFVADVALSPIVNRYPALADASLGLGAIGVVLWSIAVVLWERDPRRRRAAVLLSFAFSGIFLGYIGLIDAGSWAPAGAVAFSIGVIAFLAAFAMRVLEQEPARKAHGSVAGSESSAPRTSASGPF